MSGRILRIERILILNRYFLKIFRYFQAFLSSLQCKVQSAVQGFLQFLRKGSVKRQRNTVIDNIIAVAAVMIDREFLAISILQHHGSRLSAAAITCFLQTVCSDHHGKPSINHSGKAHFLFPVCDKFFPFPFV